MLLKEVRKSGLGISAIGQATRAVAESLESRTLLSNAGLSAWASAGPSYTPMVTSSGPSITPAVVVAIPDANLEAAIRSALGIPVADLTDADIATLVSLDAPASGIADLTGLEFATGLQTLNLSGNQITDVTPLAGLTQLTTLNLSSNQITDVSSLGGLTALTTADVSNNNIDVTAGSPSMIVIQGWIDQGTDVNFVQAPAVNEAPTDIALSNDTIDTGLPAGTVVGTFSTTDPNPGDTFTYALVDGVGSADNASFVIVDDQLQTATSLDAAVQSSYSVRVSTTDQDGLSVEKVFTVNVVVPAANEAPTDIALSNDTIATGLPAGTVVGTFSTTDPNAGDTFTYALVDGVGSADNASFTIVDDQLQTAASLDSAVQSSYSIRVSTTDQDGLSFEKTFIVNVTSGVGELRGAFGLVGGKTVTSRELLDADGDKVTFKLTGGGTGQVFGDGTAFDQVVLTGTTSKSVLTIKVKKATHGDGAVMIGNLTSDGLIMSIKAGAVIMSGPVALNTLNQNPGKAAVALQFQQLHDASIISQNLPISSLKILDSQNTDGTPDAITAPSVGSITVSGRKEKPKTRDIEFLPGDLADSVITTGAIKSIKAGRITGDIRAGKDAKGKGIGSITSTGSVIGATIATSGSVNTVKVGALLGSDVLVGMAPDFDGRFAGSPADFVNPTAKLGTLVVKGAKLASGVSHPAYVVDSNISAPNAGTITLLNVPAATTTEPIVHVLTDKGTLKVTQTKLVDQVMVPVETFKAPDAFRSLLWERVTP